MTQPTVVRMATVPEGLKASHPLARAIAAGEKTVYKVKGVADRLPLLKPPAPIKSIHHFYEVGRANQDVTLIKSDSHGALLCVFDGHGANNARTQLSSSVQSAVVQSLDNSNVSTHLGDVVRVSHDIQSAFHAQASERLNNGTTATCVHIVEPKIDVTYVGDSPAILYILQDDGSIKCTPLVYIASWKDPEVAVRVDKSRFTTKEISTKTVLWDPVAKRHFSLPSTLGDTYYAPAVSKRATQVGVTTSRPFFVVVCSDGVTDLLTYTKIGRLVMENQRAPAEVLVKTATAHAAKFVKDNHSTVGVDDTTAIVYFSKTWEFNHSK